MNPSTTLKCFRKHLQTIPLTRYAFYSTRKDKQIIPVERLVKCKFQDNLEFLQWVKKYWDSYFPGVAYDAAGRRKGGAGTWILETKLINI